MRIAALFLAFVALSAWMTVSTVFADDSATTQPDYHRLLILQPDGKPAANARVILTVEYSLCTIINGQDVTTDPNFRNQPHQFTTGADGTISVPREISPRAIVVLHESGFSQTYVDGPLSTDSVQLQPWGTVRGRLMIGDKPGAGETVQIFGEGNRPDRGIFHNSSALCDQDGNFVMSRVPVMGHLSIGRRVPDGQAILKGTLTARRELKMTPGETVDVQLGGTGRPVRVKAILPPDLDGRKDLHWQRVEVITKFQPPPDPTPDNLKNQPRDVRIKWFADYLKTDAGKALLAADAKITADWRAYNASRLSDGSFEIEDVEPGTYTLRFVVDQTLMRMVGNTYPGPLIDMHTEFTVPPTTGGRAGEPLDLGTINLELANHVTIGNIAPDFTAKTLGGKEIKLSDFRGKYVLLDFWAAWCGPCVAETPSLKAAYDAYGTDDHFAMISISLDDIAIDAASYVKKEGLGWNQIFEPGKWDQPIVKAYQVNAIPSIWLIGPDGKVIAKDLRGDAIKAAVAAALAKSGADR